MEAHVENLTAWKNRNGGRRGDLYIYGKLTLAEWHWHDAGRWRLRQPAEACNSGFSQNFILHPDIIASVAAVDGENGAVLLDELRPRR